MRVLVDGREVANATEGDSAIKLVLALQEEQHAQGRVLQTVLIDGEPVDDWQQVLRFADPLPGEVRLQTAPFSQALAETTSGFLDVLPRMEAALREASDFLRQGEEQRGLLLLGQVTEGLEWYTRFLEALAGGDGATAVGARQFLSGLEESLKRTLEAWEQSDYSLLADLLEYELAPNLSAGQDWLKVIRAKSHPV